MHLIFMRNFMHKCHRFIFITVTFALLSSLGVMGVSNRPPRLVAIPPTIPLPGSGTLCDPIRDSGQKRPHPQQNTAYFYCNSDGTLARRDCPSGKYFSKVALDCEPVSVILAPGEREPSIFHGVASPMAVQHSPSKDPDNQQKDAPLKKESLTATNSSAQTNISSQYSDETKGEATAEEEAILKQPQFQAPDDICAGVAQGPGSALTRLSAPVVCNPSVTSCPDGYQCTLHQRTGIWYCCQQPGSNQPESQLPDATTLCQGSQVTYIEPNTGLPKSCAISSASFSGCPSGFGCNMVPGGLTRCCGRDFGCPANSAGYVHPQTGAHVQCNQADPRSCPNGFVCAQSALFGTGICCSDTSSVVTDVCGGESPLGQPNPCSASQPCPFGYRCRGGRCCPAKGQCPVGEPLGGPTRCADPGSPCPPNYQCVVANGMQHCCPSSEHVCGQPREPGTLCPANIDSSSRPTITRFHFDTATGSCRSFPYSGCGGNANNFDTLDQCEGFCLDTQCPGGVGLRAGPALATCSASALTSSMVDNFSSAPSPFTIAPPVISAGDQCPSHYACVQPKYGASPICCTSPEQVCREPVQAGSPCFGPFTTFTRWHFNPEKEECEPFQYYGCSGSGNNFFSKRQCEQTCQAQLKIVCNGVAPLNDENGDYVRRCSENVGCPTGSWCNQRGYCCPHQEAACQSPYSVGHTCLSQRPGTHWYYDQQSGTCMPFTYSGCGGSPNRFSNRESCEQMCGVPGKGYPGMCPRGMTPFLTASGVKRCSGRTGACPDGSSCVQSNLGEWICCTSTAQCPVGRHPYTIPGSDSLVACLPDDDFVAARNSMGSTIIGDNCPRGFKCVQASNVPGFYMCCSIPFLAKAPPRTQGLNGNNVPSAIAALAVSAAASVMNKARGQQQSSTLQRSQRRLSPQQPQTAGAFRIVAPSMMTAVQFAAPKCPSGLPSNGESCNVNEIEACPPGFLCVSTSDDGIRGVCCRAQPKCPRVTLRPYFIARRQVLTCNDDKSACPEGTQCQRSSIPGIDICCSSRTTTTKSEVAVTSAGGGDEETAESSNGAEEQPQRQRPTLPKPSRHRPRSRPSSPSSVDELTMKSMTLSKALRSFSKGVPKVVPKCIKDGSIPFFALGSRVPQPCTADRDDECPEEYECELASDDQYYCCPAWDRCPAGSSPFYVEGSRKPLGCNWMANNCPEGYSCEGSKDRAICCRTRPSAAQCPMGRTPYLMAKRPLVCPIDAKKNTCPVGFECVPSRKGGINVCCSRLEHQSAECVHGHPFYDGATGKSQVCDPALDSCPVGYRCRRSTMVNTHVCCTIQLDNRIEGFCPPGQIPYMGTGGGSASDELYTPQPPTCHMVHSPCPTSGPYQCVYSVEKQASYCCAPVDSTPKPLASLAAFRQWGTNSGSSQRPAPYQLALQFQQQRGEGGGSAEQNCNGIVAGGGSSDNGGAGIAQQQQQPSGNGGNIPMAAYLNALSAQPSAPAVDPAQLAQQQQLAAYAVAVAAAAAQQQQLAGGGIPSGVPMVTAPMGTGSNGCPYPQNPFSPMPSSSSAIYNNINNGQQQQQISSSSQIPLDGNQVAEGSGGAQVTNGPISIASCPPYSKPLLDPSSGLGQPCSVWDRCPGGFTCYSSHPDGRNAHCCTTVPLDNRVVFRANAAALADGPLQQQQSQQQQRQRQEQQMPSQSSSFVPASAPPPEASQQQQQPVQQHFQMASPTIDGSYNYSALPVQMTGNPYTVAQQQSQQLFYNANNSGAIIGAPIVRPCPPNMVNIGGMCKRMYFVGQPGCEVNTQCTARTNGTQCVQGYCQCPHEQLIHESRCVAQCPDGFLVATGRCHDLSTIVFMDSTDQRDNGTIGGFCRETIVVEEQCSVPNAYCSERSLTCQCRPGFELRMNFANRTDQGQCVEVENSRFNQVLKDATLNETGVEHQQDGDVVVDDSSTLTVDSLEASDDIAETVEDLQEQKAKGNQSMMAEKPTAFYIIESVAGGGDELNVSFASSTTKSVSASILRTDPNASKMKKGEEKQQLQSVVSATSTPSTPSHTTSMKISTTKISSPIDSKNSNVTIGSKKQTSEMEEARQQMFLFQADE